MISLSPSGASKGVRFCSAMAAAKNRKNASGCTKMPQVFWLCHWTISLRRGVP